MTPSPFRLAVSGTVGLSGLVDLGKASVEIGGGGFGFRGDFGASFGPASVSGNVSGAFSADAFNVEGGGELCLFVCAGSQALFSSTGAAFCASIKIGVGAFSVGSISVGAGLRWGSFPDVFLTGCSVAPYRANVLNTGLSRAAGTRVTAEPGGPPQTFTVDQAFGLVTVIARGTPGGPAPRVIVTPPGGAPVALPADTVGGYRFDDATSSLIDVDPGAAATRVSVRDPQPGTWSIQAEAGSAAVQSVDVSRGVAPVQRGDLTQVAVADVPDAVAAQGAKLGLVHGTQLAPGAKLPAVALAAKTPKAKQLAKRYPGAVAGATLSRSALPKAYLPRVARLAVEATLLPGERISFSERAASTNAVIGTVPADATGKVDTELLFDPARSTDRARTIDAFVSGADGVPRAVLRDVTSYKAKALPTAALPKGTGIARLPRGDKLMLRFPAAPATTAPDAPLFRLDLVTDAGQRLSRTLTADDLVRLKGGARGFSLTDVEPGEAVTVRLAPLDLEGNAGPARTYTVPASPKAPVATVIMPNGAVRREAGKGRFVGAGAATAPRFSDPRPKVPKRLPRTIALP